MNDAEALVRWWIAIGALSIAVLPLTLWIGSGLGAAAAALARVVGPFVVAFALWWPAATVGVPFTFEWLLVTTTTVAIANWAVVVWRRFPIRQAWRWILAAEVVWGLAFVLYSLFRRENSAIAFTEKPMEIALLSSIARSSKVPAPDPWFAGEPINYYYFGYQVIAAISDVAGVNPEIAFNLALASTFASAVTIVCALAWTILERSGVAAPWRFLGAATAPMMVLVAGNLETTQRLITDPSGTVDASWWSGVGWQASRVITDRIEGAGDAPVQTINEFPAFSFVLADLHPHVVGLPYLFALIALGTGLFLAPAMARDRFRLMGLGAIAGMIYAINSWDAPVAVSILLIGIAAGSARTNIKECLIRSAIILAGSAVAVAPFVLNYSPPVGLTNAEMPSGTRGIPILEQVVRTVGVVTWQPSSSGEILTVYGQWIILAMIFLIWTASEIGFETLMRVHPAVAIIVAFVGMSIAVVWSPAIFWLGIPATIAIATFIRSHDRTTRIVSLMIAGGFALALFPEFVYVQDAFGHRMNTVFKLGYQAWLLLAIGSTVGSVLLLSRLPIHRLALVAVVVSMTALSTLTYAPLSVQDWMAMGPDRATLDGGHYLRERAPDEAAALSWLEDTARSGDIIVEVPGCGYGSADGVPMSRFSAFTGIPTLIGWDNHERQWRRSPANDIVSTVAARQERANAILDGTERPEAVGMSPRFLIYGIQEQAGVPGCDLAQPRPAGHLEQLLASGWESAYRAGVVHILVVAGDPLAIDSEN